MKKFMFVCLLGLLFPNLVGAQGVKIDRERLIAKALEYQQHSYAPYSHYNVGAAVLTASGKIYGGANVENASYPAGKCAEHNAVTRAIIDRYDRIVAVAIVGGGNFTDRDYCAPCGICRQVLREFGDPSKLQVIMAKSVKDYRELTLEQLLPLSFGPDALAK